MTKNGTIITDDEARKKFDLTYTSSLEHLIKNKSEQCEILSKLHLNSHKKYKKQELFFNIPIITITALIGFTSALNIQFDYINIIIGLLSLYVSLLKSYFSYLQISQKNENHRVAYLQYFQIANEIRIELSLSPEMRQSASYLLNLIKVKMKHLNEVSEIIPTDIIKEFNRQFKNYEMSRPEIIMSLHPIELYKETLLEEGIINYNDKIKLYKKINNEKETEEEKQIELVNSTNNNN
jgi:hypothetical protein